MRHASSYGLLLVLALGPSGCSDPDGDSDPKDPAGQEPFEEDTDSDGGSGSEEPAEPEDDAGAGSSTDNPNADQLSFEKDGELVDLAGANNASYYRKDLSNWRLVVVLNDVAGKRSLSIDVVGTGGAMLSAQSYDCSKPVDDVAMAKAKLTFRSGDETWQQATGKPCSISLTAIGEVGGRLTGTFSATLSPKSGSGPDVMLSDGVFDVKRKDI